MHVYPPKIQSCSKNIRNMSFFVLKISVVFQEKIYHRFYCMGISLVENQNILLDLEINFPAGN